MIIIGKAMLIGMLVAAAGTIPRNIIFAANLRLFPTVPWAVPVTAAYLFLFWRYLAGAGSPPHNQEERRRRLRANRLPGRVWIWAMVFGGFGIVALVLGLRLLNRMVMLPPQELPDLTSVPRLTMFSLLLMAAPVAGIVEESAFRGYMQGPIERHYGLAIAILVTGTMFAVAHLDFTWILWPYYLAVAALYSGVTYLTDSILPAIVLHTAGNTYSNFDLWFRGRAEWQAASSPAELIWATGVDASFLAAAIGLLAAFAAMLVGYRQLARVRRSEPTAVTAT